MVIVNELPPNFAELNAKFNLESVKLSVYFCWGDTIYNPGGEPIHPSIIAHEQVHCDRQSQYRAIDPGGPPGWWRRYIDDVEFRLAEEVPAHRAEFQWWLKQPGIEKPVPGFRSKKDAMLLAIATRLTSPIYGKMIRLHDARRLIGE